MNGFDYFSEWLQWRINFIGMPIPIFFHSYNHLLNVINTIRLNVFFIFHLFFSELATRLTTHKTRSIIYIAFASGKRLSSRNAVMVNRLEMMNFWVIFCQIWFCFFPFCHNHFLKYTVNFAEWILKIVNSKMAKWKCKCKYNLLDFEMEIRGNGWSVCDGIMLWTEYSVFNTLLPERTKKYLPVVCTNAHIIAYILCYIDYDH